MSLTKTEETQLLLKNHQKRFLAKKNQGVQTKELTVQPQS